MHTKLVYVYPQSWYPICTLVPCNLSKNARLHIRNDYLRINTQYITIEIPLSNAYRTCNFRDVHVQVFGQCVFAHVILSLSPYIKIHISSPCLDMHWTIENPRREIPRQTPLAQIDIRRWAMLVQIPL